MQIELITADNGVHKLTVMTKDNKPCFGFQSLNFEKVERKYRQLLKRFYSGGTLVLSS